MTGPNERDEIAAELGQMQSVAWDFFPDPDMALDDIADAILASDWLAERDRRTAATAVREAAEQARSDCDAAGDDDPCSCRFVAGWLDTRADRIERGE